MKTLKNMLAIALIVAFTVACKNDAKPEVKTVGTEVKADKKELDPNAEYAKAEFTIEGMTCAIGCAATIEKKIAKMEGVKSAKVDFDKKLAMVEYDVAKITTESLVETVKKTGETYSVKNMKTVDTFAAKKGCAVKCSPDCKDKDCKKCEAKRAECKKKCNSKKGECKASKDKKTACKADCKKACCAKEGKA